MKVEPDYKSIGALFRDGNVFKVPQYQRGYAWKSGQLEDFIEDIKSLLPEKLDNQQLDLEIEGTEGEEAEEENIEHFFGSLVCAQEARIGGHERENQLVDGQQRLTTFVLLASQLIQYYSKLKTKKSGFDDYINEKLKELNERYINYKKSVNKKTEYVSRLTLSRRDDDFFQALLKGEKPAPERDSHTRLKNAADYLQKFLAEQTKNKTIEKQIDELDAIEKVINESCNVIHMVTSKVSDAYKLFQVINDRGENLNHTDLLRAKTLGIADNGQNKHIFSSVENIWDEADKLYGSKLEKLLGYYFSSRTGEKVKTTAFYDQFMEKIIGGDRVAPQKVFEVMNVVKDELHKAALIANGEWPYSNTILERWKKNRLKILITNLKHTHPIPLLLAATHLDERKFFELVRVLEIFFFRYKHICKNKIDLATTRYLRACKLINENEFTIQNFKKSLRELIEKEATDDQFVARLKDLEYVETGDNRSLRYLLLGLEDSWRWYNNGKKEGCSGREKDMDLAAVYDFSSATLEHIYPQNPKTKNLELEELLNRLGNITILDPNLNNSLGNLDYDEKHSFLVKDSKMNINKEFAKYPVWNREQIMMREKELLEASKLIFSF